MSKDRKVIFVTGGLASGKSTVCEFLTQQGIVMIDTDEIAASVRDNPDVIYALSSEFGEDILDEQGCVIPSVLASRAFVNKDSAARLNAIMFPHILERLINAILPSACSPCQDYDVLTAEVPLLPQAHELLVLADEIIFVDTPDDIRLERAIARGMDREDALNRMELQASRNDYQAIATTVVSNTGSQEELLACLSEWWACWQARTESD